MRWYQWLLWSLIAYVLPLVVGYGLVLIGSPWAALPLLVWAALITRKQPLVY